MPTPAIPDGRYLPARGGHRVWWCETGLPGGAPVLVLHGGPGGRTRAASLAWFEGLPLRCIAFDQRGCGQSTPAGGLEHNTLAHLLDDIERLRDEAGVERWGVVGGSWGALLALAYAAAHPQRVTGLFLRSAFLGRDTEVARFFAPWAAWLGAEGAAWLAAVSADPLQLLGDVASRAAASASPARVAVAWQAFEAAQARAGGLHATPLARFTVPASATALGPDSLPAGLPQELPSGLAIQAHYLRSGCFVPPGTVEAWLDTLQAVFATRPVSLVHGLRDTVCHPDVTAALAARWPHAALHWVEEGGHDMDSAPMRQALTEAARAWAGALTQGAPA